jgi:GT2 family glycosyltransferase
MTGAGAADEEGAGLSPEVTWVIVAFHRPQELRQLVANVGRDSRVQLIVVNVESDDSVAIVARDRAAIVDIQTNVGYAAAVNAALEKARADVVVFSNDDLIAAADTVRSLASYVASGRADVAVPSLRSADGSLERSIAALPTPWTLFKEWAVLPDQPVPALERVIGAEKWRVPSSPELIQAAAATMVAVRRDLIARVPLPTAYFLYWEEMEWFWRLREVGARVLYCPDVVVQHRGGRSDVRVEKAELLARNAVRCVRRTQGRRSAALAFVAVALWNVRLVVVAECRLVTRRSPQQRRMLVARRAGLRAAIRSWREVR